MYRKWSAIAAGVMSLVYAITLLTFKGEAFISIYTEVPEIIVGIVSSLTLANFFVSIVWQRGGRNVES